MIKSSDQKTTTTVYTKSLADSQAAEKLSVDRASVFICQFWFLVMSDFLSVVDPLSGSFATLLRLPKRLQAVSRSLSCDLGQVSNSYQIVGGGSELEDPTHQLQSPVTGLTQQPDRLQPTKDFFHSFGLTLTHFITVMARPAWI